MALENIRYEVVDQVATITVDRPKVLNALNSATLDELEGVIEALKADAAVRVILLTGAGEKAFVAGADIRELAAVTAETGRAMARRGQTVFSGIENCGKPVIACINGFALGGGCELALACTLRIASETAQLGQPEVKLGIIPGYGGTQRLPRLVGKGAALKMILTGGLVNAAEALRIGLVDEVVPAEKLLERGAEVARSIIAMAPLAVKYSLDAVHRGYDLPLEEALELEAELFAVTSATVDKEEGTRAFLEKRKAVWQGR